MHNVNIQSASIQLHQSAEHVPKVHVKDFSGHWVYQMTILWATDRCRGACSYCPACHCKKIQHIQTKCAHWTADQNFLHTLVNTGKVWILYYAFNVKYIKIMFFSAHHNRFCVLSQHLFFSKFGELMSTSVYIIHKIFYSANKSDEPMRTILGI